MIVAKSLEAEIVIGMISQYPETIEIPVKTCIMITYMFKVISNGDGVMDMLKKIRRNYD